METSYNFADSSYCSYTEQWYTLTRWQAKPLQLQTLTYRLGYRRMAGNIIPIMSVSVTKHKRQWLVFWCSFCATLLVALLVNPCVYYFMHIHTGCSHSTVTPDTWTVPVGSANPNQD